MVLFTGNQCIQQHTDRKRYDDARALCRESGVNSDLVSIHGADMQGACRC